MNRTYELLKSLAGTNRSLLSQFGFSPELLENENLKREKAKELAVCTPSCIFVYSCLHFPLVEYDE